MEESDFVDGLTFEDLRKRYRSERDETLRDTLSSFEGEEEGQRRDIEAGIEDDRRHEAEEPIVILGEAKGSVSGPARVVAQTRERQQVALDPSTTSKNDT